MDYRRKGCCRKPRLCRCFSFHLRNESELPRERFSETTLAPVAQKSPTCFDNNILSAGDSVLLNRTENRNEPASTYLLATGLHLAALCRGGRIVILQGSSQFHATSSLLPCQQLSLKTFLKPSFSCLSISIFTVSPHN